MKPEREVRSLVSIRESESAEWLRATLDSGPKSMIFERGSLDYEVANKLFNRLIYCKLGITQSVLVGIVDGKESVTRVKFH